MTEPASIVFWNLAQAGGDYTFLEACAALESAYGTDPEKRSGQSSVAVVERRARVCRQLD